jgi:low affinity Fe/Cu permease
MDGTKVNEFAQQFGLIFASFVRAFIVGAIALILSVGTGVLDMGASDWKLVANAGIAAALVTLVKALDPNYTSYGIGSGSDVDA